MLCWWKCRQVLVVVLSGLLYFANAGKSNSEYCCNVTRSLLWRKQLPAGLNQEAAARIARLYKYSFVTPSQYLGSAITYYGHSTRLRRFVSELLTGSRPLKVGVTGGSISQGVGAPRGEGWFEVFCDFIVSAGKAQVTCQSGGITGTPTGYAVLCHKYSVDPELDLVFVEYAMNDGFVDATLRNRLPMASERLLRLLLDFPGRPAVVLVQSPHITVVDILKYYQTSEFLGAANAAYYDIPTVSPHAALHHMTYTDELPDFAYKKTFSERHPGSQGHKVYSDLLVHLIQETAVDLIHRPLTDRELKGSRAPLPVPIVPGNEPPGNASCMIAQDFQQLVLSARGFVWSDEGDARHHRWGYIANTTGSSLTFQVNTVRGFMDANTPVSVFLYYVHSNMPMGTALLECVAGCTCNATEVDAYVEKPSYGTGLAAVDATQSHACQIRVQVLKKTSSGGRKFKVVGAVASEQTSSDVAVREYQFGNGIFFKNPGVDIGR